MGDKLVPTEVTAVTIITAMRAPIKAYSIAVTPVSVFKNILKIFTLYTPCMVLLKY